MKCAIMQPYIYPNISYYQLIDSVDYFIILDDVNFKKKSFINRNFFQVNNTKKLISFSISKISQNKLINEIKYCDINLEKNIKSILYLKEKKENFNIVKDLISKTFKNPNDFLININCFSINEIINYLGIKTKILLASKIDNNKLFAFEERLIYLTKKIGCNTYVNLEGGKKIYKKENFQKKNVDLMFLHSTLYEKNEEKFSILEDIMDLDMTKLKNNIKQYSLV